MAKFPPKNIPFFKKLDNREKLFVQEYLTDLDVERAALAAGYSKSMAVSKAYQWVSHGKVKPHVFNAIQEGFKKREVRTERTADEVINLLWRMIEYSLEDYFDISESGEITAKRFDQLKPGAAKLINSIKFKKHALRYSEVNEGFLDISDIEYKMPNKDKMIELLMKHHGLFEKDNQQGINEVMLAAILAGLPTEKARENVKKALMAIATKKTKA